MRFLSFFIFLFCFLNALTSSEVKITPSFKKLQIFIPTQEDFQTLNKENSLILTFSSPLIGESIKKELSSPFQTLQITQNQSNKTQIILYGKNLSLSTQKSENGMTLTFTSEIYQVQWWRYFGVLAVLSILLIALFFLKKRLKNRIPHSQTHYTEIPLKANAKLITLEYQDQTYLIFCNEKGCALLNRYSKTKDNNKEFIDLIKEE